MNTPVWCGFPLTNVRGRETHPYNCATTAEFLAQNNSNYSRISFSDNLNKKARSQSNILKTMLQRGPILGKDFTDFASPSKSPPSNVEEPQRQPSSITQLLGHYCPLSPLSILSSASTISPIKLNYMHNDRYELAEAAPPFQFINTSPLLKHGTSERPSQPTAVNETPKAPPVSKCIELCEFEVHDISFDMKQYDGFSVILIPSLHGLYDLIKAAFDHSLTNLTGWDVDSRQWTLEYAGKLYHSHSPRTTVDEMQKSSTHLDASLSKPVVSSYDRWPFLSSKLSTPLNLEVSKGRFTLNRRNLSFNFKLLDIATRQMKRMSEIDAYPICAEIQRDLVYTANNGLEHISQEAIEKVAKFRKQYKEYFNDLNSWQLLKDPKCIYIPSRPAYPAWSKAEIRIIGLFKNSGMKFANAWNSGLQYAFVLRSKASTSSKWYSVQSWEILNCGSELTKSKKIILAKQLSLKLMQSTLEFGLPTPVPKPPPLSLKRTHGEMKESSKKSFVVDFSSYYVPPPLRES